MADSVAVGVHARAPVTEERLCEVEHHAVRVLGRRQRDLVGLRCRSCRRKKPDRASSEQPLAHRVVKAGAPISAMRVCSERPVRPPHSSTPPVLPRPPSVVGPSVPHGLPGCTARLRQRSRVGAVDTVHARRAREVDGGPRLAGAGSGCVQPQVSRCSGGAVAGGRKAEKAGLSMAPGAETATENQKRQRDNERGGGRERKQRTRRAVLLSLRTAALTAERYEWAVRHPHVPVHQCRQHRAAAVPATQMRTLWQGSSTTSSLRTRASSPRRRTRRTARRWARWSARLAPLSARPLGQWELP